jgi:hypothetical protein
MADRRAVREVALERTFGLYVGHLLLWLALLLPVAATAALVLLGVRAIVGSVVDVAAAPPHLQRAADAIPIFAAIVWLLAGTIGGQTIGLAVLRTGAAPQVNPILAGLLRRAPRLLAATTLVCVLVAAAGLAGTGAAVGVASLPRLLAPALGLSESTGKALSLLILLPCLVAGIVPALWVFGRHILAVPLAAILERPPFAILAAGRAISRGSLGSILGLFIVTTLAGNVAVLLCRLVGSLGTLLFAREYFRPIFGSGPLGTDAGLSVQFVATAIGTLITLPLQLLPFAYFGIELSASGDGSGEQDP